MTPKTKIMNIIAICIVATVIFGFLLANSVNNIDNKTPTPQFATGTLDITRGGNVVKHLSVEIAKTTAEMEYGLMFRHEMADDRGMIFVFPFPQRIQMWMKNTFIPLDMVFFDDNQKIVAIIANAKPQDETVLDPGTEARYVLEINASLAAKWQLQNGDTFQLKAN